METSEIKEFIKSKANSPVEWDGIRLQPIADRLFMLANELLTEKTNSEQIPERFKHMIELV